MYFFEEDINLLNDEKIKYFNESYIKMQYRDGDYHQIIFSLVIYNLFSL